MSVECKHIDATTVMGGEAGEARCTPDGGGGASTGRYRVPSGETNAPRTGV